MGHRKKIVFVVSDWGHGGTPRHVSLLANGLVRRGYDIAIMAYSAERSEDYFPLEDGIQTHFLRRDFGDSEKARLQGLRARISQLQPDLVFSVLSDINVRTLLALFGAKIPVICVEFSHPIKQPLSHLSRLLRLALYPFAKQLIVQTAEAKTFYPPWVQAKTTVIANPIPLRTEPLVQDNKTIMSAGRLSEEKNFTLLLDAFTQVKAKHPDWSLVIWGEGPRRFLLEHEAQKLDLSPDIFKGLSTTPDAWLGTGTIFAMCSQYEGFPNALADAMAAGYPVAVTPFSCGPRDMIANGVDGLIATEETAEALADALNTLIENPERARSFGDKAQQKARQDWIVDRIVDEWKRIVDLFVA